MGHKVKNFEKISITRLTSLKTQEWEVWGSSVVYRGRMQSYYKPTRNSTVDLHTISYRHCLYRFPNLRAASPASNHQLGKVAGCASVVGDDTDVTTGILWLQVVDTAIQNIILSYNSHNIDILTADHGRLFTPLMSLEL